MIDNDSEPCYVNLLISRRFEHQIAQGTYRERDNFFRGGLHNIEIKNITCSCFIAPKQWKKDREPPSRGKKAQWLKKKKFGCSLGGIADEIKGKANQTSLKGTKCTTSRETNLNFTKKKVSWEHPSADDAGVGREEEDEEAGKVCLFIKRPASPRPTSHDHSHFHRDYASTDQLAGALQRRPPRGPQLVKLIVLETVL